MNMIDLDGYIDSEEWWGDEITPDMIKRHLANNPGDVVFRLNSYGGSCNAAVRMYDMLREHPGNVTIRISGAACSAASFLALGADRVEITPGSQIMIHDPACMAWGQEKEIAAALDMLRSTKESILNIYARSVTTPREELAELMTAEKWYDAEEALAAGFVHAITGDDSASGGVLNAAGMHQSIDRDEARGKVRAWIDRQASAKQKVRSAQPTKDSSPQEDPPAPEHDAGFYVANKMRLLLMEV